MVRLEKRVELCNQGQNDVAVKTLYAEDIVSVAAAAPAGGVREKKGLADVIPKGQWWMENHQIHNASIVGPFPHDDRFIVPFSPTT